MGHIWVAPSGRGPQPPFGLTLGSGVGQAGQSVLSEAFFGRVVTVGSSLATPYNIRKPGAFFDGRSVFRIAAAGFVVLIGGDLWQPRGAVDDFYLARLPFQEAQRLLSQTAPISGSPRRAKLGWHHTFLDPETSAFAIVHTGGPLADLVGERLRISLRDERTTRTVTVYCHREADLRVEGDPLLDDISLTRLAFAQLALLPTSQVAAHVEVLS